jgi:uncharacterized protein (TIGR04222 family)
VNEAQRELYLRLQAYELDDSSHEFGFMRHLIKGQGWSMVYAQRAVEEYKRFAFLAVVAEHQVVPPDAVDQVWHQHVLLTQSYWDGFCGDVLQKKLHHHPARGGRAERAEFHLLYGQTIVSYRHFFGEPPQDIWSPIDRRFGPDLKMQRVSLADHWVIPKRLPQMRVSRGAGLTMLAIAVTFLSAGCTYASGAQALSLHASILGAIAVAMVVSWGLQYLLRLPMGRSELPELDIYEMACLFGGEARVVDLVIVQLLAQGYLSLNVRNRSLGVVKMLPSDADWMLQQAMQQIRLTPEIKLLRKALREKTVEVRRRLSRKGLRVNAWISFLLVLLSALSLFCAFILGIGLFVFVHAEGWVWVDVFSFLLLGKWILNMFSRMDLTHQGMKVLGAMKRDYDLYDLEERFAVVGASALSGGVMDELKGVFTAVDQEVAAESGCGGCGC